MTKIFVHRAAVEALKDAAAVRQALEREGDKVAERAKARAPRDSGAGAASIHAETAEDGSVRISWDRDHFYMLFHELGTSKLPARPFLRPALDQ